MTRRVQYSVRAFDAKPEMYFQVDADHCVPALLAFSEQVRAQELTPESTAGWCVELYADNVFIARRAPDNRPA